MLNGKEVYFESKNPLFMVFLIRGHDLIYRLVICLQQRSHWSERADPAYGRRGHFTARN
jgi:hypothetical protein